MHNQDYRKEYTSTLTRYIENQPKIKSNQDRWTNVVNAINQAASETLGHVDKQTKYKNPNIKLLSEQQKKLNKDLNSTNDPKQKRQIRKERNRLLTNIHNLIINEQKTKIELNLVNIENKPDDSRKMFETIKTIKKLTPKQPLLLQGKSGLVANEEEQTNIIAEYFKTQYFKNAEKLPTITPVNMKVPFTKIEVRNAIKKLKNNKSPGNDGIIVELLKYSPEKIFEIIAEIYNQTACTGEYPKEITQGILHAIQKPGKTKGPPQNLRPIILLSVLRKVLAICLMERINERIDKIIPLSQAAYRKGRSTTEHIFSTKLLIERTISSSNETIYLLMHDMSKAFDSVNRNILLNDLNEILEQDELHLIRILLNVELCSKCGIHTSEYFQTDTGVPQGDCMSANEFTLYLAKSLNNDINYEHDYAEIHQQEINQQLHEHNYSHETNSKTHLHQPRICR